MLYGATAIPFFTREHKTVTDATGMTWNTSDIYETSALVTVYGMFFIALLALLRIAQQHTADVNADKQADLAHLST